MKHLKKFNEGLGEDYVTTFLEEKPEITQCFNRHFPNDNIKDFVQKIPWRKSPGIEISFGSGIDPNEVREFGLDFDNLASEQGWKSQWDGIDTLLVYEATTDNPVYLDPV
jgi:hypothetical protein